MYRGRNEGKCLPRGQGLTYSPGGSQITPQGPDAFRVLRRSLDAGGSTGTLNRARDRISVKVQGTLICPRTNNVRRHDLHFPGARELAARKGAMRRTSLRCAAA